MRYLLCYSHGSSGLCLCQNNVPLNGPLNGAVGGSVEFRLINPPPPPFQHIIWTFKNAPIITLAGGGEIVYPGYVDRVSVDETTASLLLKNLTVNDTGEYAVSTFSNTASRGETTLTVFEIIQTDPIISSGGTLIAGNSSVNLTCDVRGTIITREWVKDGEPLSPSNRTTFHEKNRTLSISLVEKEDNGLYMCNVSNPISTDTSNHQLLINYGPHNVIITAPQMVTTGDSVSLQCAADSVPLPSFTWMLYGVEIGDKSELVIDKVVLSHAGVYSCVALNSITSHRVSTTHTLDVRDSNPLSEGTIAGIVIGSAAGICLVAGLLAFGLKKAGVW
ncbi:hypothetical protein ACEWY4_019729 [Coilia grayii]|uniref:Ig-like domain-containing protein n=1 Tax=Coilia grayii TaxID=363190 RepID=A0ABD1JBS8_9TELE